MSKYSKRIDVTSRRTFLKATGGVSVGGLLAGCMGNGDGGGGDGGSDGGGSDGGDGGSTPMDGGGGTQTGGGSGSPSTQLAVAHYPGIPDTVPFQVGIDQGFYEKHGVTVESVTSFSGGGTTVRGIVTGGIGMGGTALPALVQGYLAGAPIYVSGIEVAYPPIDFHVLPDSPIETIQDVAGGTVAVSNPGSSSEAMTIASVEAADGISLDDVEILAAGGLGEAITAMKQGAADVTWNIVPTATEMIENGESRRVWWARDYAPNVTEMVIAVGGTVRQNNPELARNLLAAHVEAFDWTKNNVEDAARIWAANADIDEALAIQSLKDCKPDKMFNIELKEEILKSTADTMITQGLIDEQPPWQEIAWQDALPEDKQLDWLK